MNVIGKCREFTDSGGVIVALANSKSKLICTVEEHGIGVSPQSRDKLFRLFHKSILPFRKESADRVGPYFIKTLAEILGGDVELKQSTLGKGQHLCGHNQLWKCAQYKPRA